VAELRTWSFKIRSLAIRFRGKHSTENPHVGGSIPPLAIFNEFGDEFFTLLLLSESRSAGLVPGVIGDHGDPGDC
jgi:hypothetical protein